MTQGRFISGKVIDGFSTCFRQWRSAPIHCSKLHGYSVSFEVVFEGELDHRNWVMDFGFLKRSAETITLVEYLPETGIWAPAATTGKGIQITYEMWFKRLFDHTVVVAEDDPCLSSFIELHKAGALSLIVLPQLGCELFAKLVFDRLNDLLVKQGKRDKVQVIEVTCREHNKNFATYAPNR